MNCLENLSRCKASCCRKFVFELRTHPGSHIEQYYRTRGLIIHRLSREVIEVHVPHNCVHLTKDNLCDLHDTDRKPFYCNDLNDDTIKRKQYLKTEGCNLGDV